LAAACCSLSAFVWPASSGSVARQLLCVSLHESFHNSHKALFHIPLTHRWEPSRDAVCRAYRLARTLRAQTLPVLELLQLSLFPVPFRLCAFPKTAEDDDDWQRKLPLLPSFVAHHPGGARPVEISSFLATFRCLPFGAEAGSESGPFHTLARRALVRCIAVEML